MRLVRLADNAFGGNGEGREASAAIAATVGHVDVDAEVLPACGEGWPFGQRRRRQERAELRSGREPEPRRSNCLGDDQNIAAHRASRAIKNLPYEAGRKAGYDAGHASRMAAQNRRWSERRRTSNGIVRSIFSASSRRTRSSAPVMGVPST